MTGRAESSGLYSFVGAGFMQLSHEATISGWLRSTESAGLARTLRRNIKRKSHWSERRSVQIGF